MIVFFFFTCEEKKKKYSIRVLGDFAVVSEWIVLIFLESYNSGLGRRGNEV